MTDREAFERWLEREMRRIRLARIAPVTSTPVTRHPWSWLNPPASAEVEALIAEMTERFRNAP